MSDYKSKYKGLQIDSLLDKVNNADTTPTQDSNNLILSGGVKSALNQKQDVISDLPNIRSGAAAGATAYQKPSSGIPETDLSEGVKEVLANAVRLEEYDISDTEMLAVNLQNKILLVSVSDNSISTAVYLLCGTDDSTNTIVKRIHGMIDGDEPLEFYAGTSGSNNYIVPSAPTNKIMLAWLNGSSAVEVVDRELGDTERLFFSVGAEKDLEATVGNLATFDENGNPVDSGISSEKFSEIEGKITDLSQSAGIAGGIADTTSAGTEQNITFRKSGGDGVNYMKRIKGKTLVWNQLVPHPDFSDGTNTYSVFGSADFAVTDGALVATVTTASGSIQVLKRNVGHTAGHKYYVWSIVNSDKNISSVTIYGCGVSVNGGNLIAKRTCKLEGIVIPAASSADAEFNLGLITVSTFTVGEKVRFYGGGIVDLTLLYGSAIDGMTNEQIIAKYEAEFGTGVHPQNPGTLISNDAESLETGGFNQFDKGEVKEGYSLDDNSGLEVVAPTAWRSGWIPVLPNAVYYVSHVIGAFYGYAVQFYDKEKNHLYGAIIPGSTYDQSGTITTPANAAFVRLHSSLSVGYQEVSFNLSNTAKNGTHEPFWKRTQNLGLNDFKVKDGDNIITVNGLKSAGSVYDEISNGKYIKRIGEVDLGTLNYLYSVPYKVFHAELPIVPVSQGSGICSKYGNSVKANIVASSSSDKVFTIGGTYYWEGHVTIEDSSYTDAATFKAAMSGVKLYYAIATPVEYELAEPIPNAILCDEDGTEQAIFPTHEDGTPSAPLCVDSNYSISVAKLVKAIKSLNG